MSDLDQLLLRVGGYECLDLPSFRGRSALITTGFTHLVGRWSPTSDVEASLSASLAQGAFDQWIRVAQLHFVDARWTQEETPAFWTELVGKVANAKIVRHTANMAVMPWTLWPLHDVLSQEAERLELGNLGYELYLQLESDEVRTKRIRVLIENDLRPLALRLQLFLLRLYGKTGRMQALNEETRAAVRRALELMAFLRDERMLMHCVSKVSQSELCAMLQHYCGPSASTLIEIDPQSLTRIQEMLFGLVLNKLASKEAVEDPNIFDVVARVDFTKSKRLKDTAQAFVLAVPSTKKIYALAKAWFHKLDRTWGLNYVLKAYLTALVVDLNKYEQLRLKERNSELNEVELRCSQVFVDLATILYNHVLLRRECLLTAFSLRPKEALLGQLENCVSEDNRPGTTERSSEALKSDQTDQPPSFNDPNFESTCEDLIGSLGQESFLESNPQHQRQERKWRDLKALLAVDGELMTQAANYDALASPIAHFLTVDSVDKDVIEDLLAAISAPRWKCLSWVLDWSELQTKCRALMDNPTLHCGEVELKHLVIDYSQFEDDSEEEDLEAHSGIEKGYENRRWEKESDVKPVINTQVHQPEPQPNTTIL